MESKSTINKNIDDDKAKTTTTITTATTTMQYAICNMIPPQQKNCVKAKITTTIY